MAECEESRWANNEFSRKYRDGADIYLPFRKRFVEVTKSLYSFVFKDRKDIRILDLGCGDGFFAEELLKNFSPAGVTLSDGFDDMLNAARERLKNSSNMEYLHCSGDLNRLMIK